MITKSVAISGTIGKQTFATSCRTILRGLTMWPGTSAASVAIRDGNASGTLILQHSTVANDSNPLLLPGLGIRFDRGMHVKVLGASGALCYLYLD